MTATSLKILGKERSVKNDCRKKCNRKERRYPIIRGRFADKAQSPCWAHQLMLGPVPAAGT